MYSIPLLSKQLGEIAENMLPKGSGQHRLLRVLIKFSYGKFSTEDWLAGEDDTQHISIVFWRPNNAMLVAYNYEPRIEDISDDYIITANHDSTWKYDGLNFFHKILKEPKEWAIIEQKVVDITETAEVHNTFIFTPAVVV